MSCYHLCRRTCMHSSTSDAPTSCSILFLRQVATFKRCRIILPPQCGSSGDFWRTMVPEHLRLTSCAREEPPSGVTLNFKLEATAA